ncbi:MAG: hypothetical protein ABIR17_09020 [Pseudolysinimonas sp.]
MTESGLAPLLPESERDLLYLTRKTPPWQVRAVEQLLGLGD